MRCIHRGATTGEAVLKCCGKQERFRCATRGREVTESACRSCKDFAPTTQRGTVLMLTWEQFRRNAEQRIIRQLRHAGWNVLTAPQERKAKLWGVPDAVEACATPPDALIRWEEHSSRLCNPAWSGACAYLAARDILPIQMDWAWFDHYHQFIFNEYDPAGQPTIAPLWDECPPDDLWHVAPRALRNYRARVLADDALAGELGPVPGVPSDYVLLYTQGSYAQSRLPCRSYPDWCARASAVVRAAGLTPVWKHSPAFHFAAPPDDPAFRKGDKIPALNARLLRYCRHAVAITSTVSNEALLTGRPMVMCGKSWHDGLGVFAEARAWEDIAVTPEIDRAARGRYANFWIRESFRARAAAPALERVMTRAKREPQLTTITCIYAPDAATEAVTTRCLAAIARDCPRAQRLAAVDLARPAYIDEITAMGFEVITLPDGQPPRMARLLQAATAAATAPVILTVESDVILKPGNAYALASRLAALPADVAAIESWCVNEAGELTYPDSSWRHAARWLYAPGLRPKSSYTCWACTAFRRAALDRLDWDRLPQLEGADIRAGEQLRALGYRLLCMPAVRPLHLAHTARIAARRGRFARRPRA